MPGLAAAGAQQLACLPEPLHAFLPAGTLPLRVSPSKTPVRIESRRNQDARAAQPPLGAGPPGMPAGMAMAGAGGAPLGSHPQLPPALLMAVAGLHMYPGSYHG